MRGLLLRILRARVVHFVVLGGAIFAAAKRSEDPTKIALAKRDLDAIHAAHAARIGALTLSSEETKAVDDRAINDEILYREAIRYGLDRGDNVVRAHLVQKMLLLAEDMAGATRTPSDRDLRTFYESTRERWVRGTRVHFVHVFAQRHDAIDPLADAAKKDPDHTRELGDAFPSSRDITGDRASIAMVYGESFADRVIALPLGSWSEPIESKFGWHVVRVITHDGGHPATYEEVHDELALEWAIDRRHRAIESFMTRALDRYRIMVDGVRTTAAAPTQRLAKRTDPSAED